MVGFHQRAGWSGCLLPGPPPLNTPQPTARAAQVYCSFQRAASGRRAASAEDGACARAMRRPRARAGASCGRAACGWRALAAAGPPRDAGGPAVGADRLGRALLAAAAQPPTFPLVGRVLDRGLALRRASSARRRVGGRRRTDGAGRPDGVDRGGLRAASETSRGLRGALSTAWAPCSICGVTGRRGGIRGEVAESRRNLSLNSFYGSSSQRATAARSAQAPALHAMTIFTYGANHHVAMLSAGAAPHAGPRLARYPLGVALPYLCAIPRWWSLRALVAHPEFFPPHRFIL